MKTFLIFVLLTILATVVYADCSNRFSCTDTDVIPLQPLPPEITVVVPPPAVDPVCAAKKQQVIAEVKRRMEAHAANVYLLGSEQAAANWEMQPYVLWKMECD